MTPYVEEGAHETQLQPDADKVPPVPGEFEPQTETPAAVPVSEPELSRNDDAVTPVEFRSEQSTRVSTEDGATISGDETLSPALYQVDGQ